MKTLTKQLIKKYGKRAMVAEKLGISLQYVYMLEAGQRPSEQLRKLGRLLLNEENSDDR